MIELNTSLVRNFEIDTNNITPPIDFLINLATEGTYDGEVLKNDRFFAKIQVNCQSDSAHFQQDIELSELSENGVNAFSVQPGGYLIFYITEGDDYYSIHLNKDETMIFDNRNITGNELLALTLVTPGNYQCTNTHPQSTLAIEVRESSEDSFDEPEPVQVKITDTGFSEERVSIESAQAILFELRKGSRLEVVPESEDELVKMLHSWDEAFDSIRKENTK